LLSSSSSLPPPPSSSSSSLLIQSNQSYGDYRHMKYIIRIKCRNIFLQ
jgi:hypothetical protein